MKTWSLREEILNLFHQWWQIMVCILLGGALGWTAAWLWPSPYHAVTTLYVGLDAYRSYADREFAAYANQPYTNLDDYKNWQMSQLDEIIYQDDILQAALSELQQQDQAWQQVTAPELRKILQAEWRSAGKWSLVAVSASAKMAAQASQTWSQVVIKRIEAAISSAQEMLRLDIHMQAVAKEQAQLKTRLAALQNARRELTEMRQELTGYPADQALETRQRWLVLAFVAPLADYSPTWVALLAEQPSPEALPAVYLAWLAQVEVVVDLELPTVQNQSKALEQESANMLADYTLQSQASLGVSPNLIIAARPDTPTEVSIVRPTRLLILIMAGLGLLVWLLMRLVQIARHSGDEAP